MHDARLRGWQFVDRCGACLRVLVFLPHLLALSPHYRPNVVSLHSSHARLQLPSLDVPTPETVKDPEGCITRRPLYVDLTEHWRTVQVPCEDDDGQRDEGVGRRKDVEKRMKEEGVCKPEGWEDGEWSYRMNSSQVSSSFHVFPFYLGLGLGFDVWCPFLLFVVVWGTMLPDADRLHYLLHTFVVGRHRGPHSLFSTTVLGCGLAFRLRLQRRPPLRKPGPSSRRPLTRRTPHFPPLSVPYRDLMTTPVRICI